MAFYVVEKKRPLIRPPPPILFTDSVEIDGERCDQVKLPAEIRQRLERLDRPDASLDPEKIDKLGEERELVDI